MDFIRAFIEDCKYYDIEKKEIKTILKYVKLKGKKVLDIGAGVGRLSFPLSRYSKEVIALDSDKRFKDYFKKNKKKKVKFVNQKAEDYLRKKRKFDVILLAWPTINFNLIGLIKNVMDEDSLFAFITCDNNSDFEKIIDKLETGKNFEKDIKNKKRFINELPKKFNILIKKKINTKYTYPNEKIAFRVLKNSMQLWFNTRFDKKREFKLKEIIKNHKRGEKIIFGEKIYFYLMRK